MFLTQEQALKSISAVAKYGPKFDELVQRIAVTAVGYSVLHGDITIGQKLCAALTRGARLDALVQYLIQHGNFDWNTKSKTLVHRVNETASHDPAELYLSANAAKWYNAKKPAEPKPFNVDEAFDAFIAKLVKNGAEPLAVALMDARNGELAKLGMTDAEKHAVALAVKAVRQAEEGDEVVLKFPAFSKEEAAETAELLKAA